jgi:hypothetical protein
MAAAHQGDPITSRALLNEAETSARRLGADANHYFTAFGPTNVGVHRVSAAVALGDGGAAIQYAKAVHPIHLPVVERRAQHLVDVARGHGQAGGDDQALRALLTAERLAPEEVRYQPTARALVTHLLHRERAGPSGSFVRWPNGSALSLDAIIGRASWRAVPDRLRRTPSP